MKKHVEKFRTIFRHAIGIAIILVLFSAVIGMQNAIFFPSSSDQKTIVNEVINKSLAEQILGADKSQADNEAINENQLTENKNQNSEKSLTENEQEQLIKELEKIAVTDEKIIEITTDNNYGVSFNATKESFELTFSTEKGNYLALFDLNKNLTGVYRLASIKIGQ